MFESCGGDEDELGDGKTMERFVSGETGELVGADRYEVIRYTDG